jgi:hypothetical protein
MSCNLLKWDRPSMSWTIASTRPSTIDQCRTGLVAQHAEVLPAAVWSPKDLSPKSLTQYIQNTHGTTVTQSFFADSADAFGKPPIFPSVTGALCPATMAACS